MTPQDITTEDLLATCQNFPATDDALVCACELERRVGANEYSNRVFSTQHLTPSPIRRA